MTEVQTTLGDGLSSDPSHETALIAANSINLRPKGQQPPFIFKGGVYHIVHNDTGREYIGQASNFYDRWKCHLRDLSKQKHHSWRLQSAWLQHGITAFSFGILRVITDIRPCGLYPVEQAYLDVYKPYYNTSLVAGTVQGTETGLHGMVKGAYDAIATEGSLSGDLVGIAMGEVERYLLLKDKLTQIEHLWLTTIQREIAKRKPITTDFTPTRIFEALFMDTK